MQSLESIGSGLWTALPTIFVATLERLILFIIDRSLFVRDFLALGSGLKEVERRPDLSAPSLYLISVLL